MDRYEIVILIAMIFCCIGLVVCIIGLIEALTDKEIFKWIGRKFMNLLGILLITMMVIINYIIIVPVILLLKQSLKDLLFSEYEEDNHLGYLILKKRWGLLTDHILFMLCLNTPSIHWWWYSIIKELDNKANWYDSRYRIDDKDGKSVSKY